VYESGIVLIRRTCSVLLLALVACSSSSKTTPDGGDGGPDVPQSEAGPTDTNAPDLSNIDADAPGLDAGDAPSDGLAASCAEAVHDPVLGTAKLSSSFFVVDSAILPVTSWLPVAVVDESVDGGVALVVYGYNGDGKVHRLGAWPNLSAPDATNLVFDAVSTADRARQVMITPSLVTTHGRLLAGYRTIQAGGFVTGGVSMFDTARPDAGTRWLAAPGIESALGLGSVFLVGGDGLGAVTGPRGVFGVKSDDATAAPAQVAKYPTVPNDVVRPGLMALTSNGLPVMGYYVDGANRHSVRLPPAAALTDALSGGAPIDLGAAKELTQSDDVVNLTSFGPGLAVLHSEKVRGILPLLGHLDFHALTPGGDAGTTVGPAVRMLSANDEGCTVVSQLVPVTGGITIIVGLWDKNGQRLVRLRAL
jgi:hypothetical protein